MGCCNAKPDVATRAGMCAVCPKMRLERCTIDGRECVDHATGGDCPRGRYPDGDGLVRWVGARWVGMPAPLRWRFEARYGRDPRVDGCGCVAALNRFWVDGGSDGDGVPSGRWDAAGLIVAAWRRFWRVCGPTGWERKPQITRTP